MVKKNIKLIKGCVLIILYLVGYIESQLHVGRLETEVKERSSQMEALSSQLQEIKVEKAQLVEQLASINSLLEASQANKEDKNQVGHHFSLSRVRRVHMPCTNLTPFVMFSNRERLQNWTNCGSGKCLRLTPLSGHNLNLFTCLMIILSFSQPSGEGQSAEQPP